MGPGDIQEPNYVAEAMQVPPLLTISQRLISCHTTVTWGEGFST